MGLVGHQQVQLGIFFDLHTDLVQALDRGVAGEEVLGPGAEGDDFQLAQANQRAGDGLELADHLGDILGGAHGVLGDKSFQMAHP